MNFIHNCHTVLPVGVILVQYIINAVKNEAGVGVVQKSPE